MPDGSKPDDFLREKDRALSERCAAAARAASEGIDWLSRHREPSGRIAQAQKRLRQQAVEARRLATAAARPMSVGVFGASQMGKSFLIGKLIAPESRPAKVIFGQGDDAVRRDFLSEINPAGGDETTGLVTRFSLRTIDTPPGNPVVLRMLHEVDIVKILANTFQHDCKGQYRIQTGAAEEDVLDRTPTPEKIAALGETLSAMRRPEPQPGMTVEDVYELREYLGKMLGDHKLADPVHEPYWMLLETVLPHLDAAGRQRALSPLWGELEEFDDLFLRLKAALDVLGHPHRVFTSIDALKDRSRGVLHVNTLRELDSKAPQQNLNVVSAAGASASLPTCIVTALTAELCVTLETAPWDFFSHTDLLDFPGARSRENKAVRDFLRDPSEPTARSNCFLRGKVALLFDNYAADLDLNVMLLCAGFENQEVKSLSELVGLWIDRTHGHTPEDRRGKPTGLFFCCTKSDTLFIRKRGNEAPVQTRLNNNLHPHQKWAETWTPDAPFDNLFFIRNPGIEDRGMFRYAAVPDDAPDDYVPPEIGLTDEFQAYVDEKFRPEYLAEPLVRKHVAEPERKLDELMRLNDGGTSLLADTLAPVCNPDLKYAQVAPRAEHAITAIAQQLEDFHESGDLEKRLAERTARIGKLIHALRRKPALIGPFIADFQIEASLMEGAYRHWRRNRVETEVEEDVFASVFDDPDDQPKGQATEGFGRVLVEYWAKHIDDQVADSPWRERLDTDEEALRGFVEELVIGAERRDIARRLETRIDAFTQNSMHLDAAASRVSIFAAFALNEEVNFPGGRHEAGNRDRFGPGGALTDGVDGLPEDPKAMERIRLLYFRDWMDALGQLTRDNASSGASGIVDVAANEALGAILARLGGRG